MSGAAKYIKTYMLQKVKKMIQEISGTRCNRNIAVRVLAVLLMMLLTVTVTFVSYGYAAEDEADAAPVRESHRVKVGDRKYCVFVCDNAVLTPGKIGKMTDNELTVEILRRSGFYMMQANCRKEDHEAMDAEDWIKKGGSFMLSQKDIDSLRGARPSDGKPVKLHMDLLISTDPYVEEKEDSDVKDDKSAGDKDGQKPAHDEEKKSQDEDNLKPAGSDDQESGSDAEQGTPVPGDQTDTAENGDNDPAGPSGDENPGDDAADNNGGDDAADNSDDNEDSEASEEIKPEKKSRRTYSTYKLLRPELLFVVVATKADASEEDDSCREDRTADRGDKDGDEGDGDPGEEMLPEFRTIAMTDREGPPLEKTLEDGTPVTLTWEEPEKHADSPERPVTHYLPAALAGLGLIAAAAAVVAVRKRKNR